MFAFFLNFGGPLRWYSNDIDIIPELLHICQTHYKKTVKIRSLVINNINAIIYTYGIHRALYVEISEDSSHETLKLFFSASSMAYEYTKLDYDIRKNNCISAVATVLHHLDKYSMPPNIVTPCFFNKYINQYCGTYTSGTVVATFIEAYQLALKNECPLFRKKFWVENRVSNIEDIIEHAYESNNRTRHVLIELGWILKDKHLLKPAKKSPLPFKKILEDYNIRKKIVHGSSNTNTHILDYVLRPFCCYNFFNSRMDMELVLEQSPKIERTHSK